MASLSGKDRRKYKDEILKTLYKYLEEEMDGAEPPYTFAQVLQYIKLGHTFKIMIFLAWNVLR